MSASAGKSPSPPFRREREGPAQRGSRASARISAALNSRFRGCEEIASNTKLSFRDGPQGRARNLEGSVPSRKSTQGLMWHSARDGTEAGLNGAAGSRAQAMGIVRGRCPRRFVEKGGCRRGRVAGATIGEMQARPSGFLRAAEDHDGSARSELSGNGGWPPARQDEWGVGKARAPAHEVSQ